MVTIQLCVVVMVLQPSSVMWLLLLRVRLLMELLLVRMMKVGMVMLLVMALLLLLQDGIHGGCIVVASVRINIIDIIISRIQVTVPMRSSTTGTIPSPVVPAALHR